MSLSRETWSSSVWGWSQGLGEVVFPFLGAWLFPWKRLELSVPRTLCAWPVIPLRYPVLPLGNTAWLSFLLSLSQYNSFLLALCPLRPATTNSIQDGVLLKELVWKKTWPVQDPPSLPFPTSLSLIWTFLVSTPSPSVKKNLPVKLELIGHEIHFIVKVQRLIFTSYLYFNNVA